MHPLKPQAIGYMLHLPRILKPSLSVLCCISNLGTPMRTALVMLKVPTNAVMMDGQLREIDLNGCTATRALSYICTASLNVNDVSRMHRCAQHWRSRTCARKEMRTFHYIHLNTSAAIFQDTLLASLHGAQKIRIFISLQI